MFKALVFVVLSALYSFSQGFGNPQPYPLSSRDFNEMKASPRQRPNVKYQMHRTQTGRDTNEGRRVEGGTRCLSLGIALFFPEGGIYMYIYSNGNSQPVLLSTIILHFHIHHHHIVLLLLGNPQYLPTYLPNYLLTKQATYCPSGINAMPYYATLAIFSWTKIKGAEQMLQRLCFVYFTLPIASTTGVVSFANTRASERESGCMGKENVA